MRFGFNRASECCLAQRNREKTRHYFMERCKGRFSRKRGKCEKITGPMERVLPTGIATEQGVLTFREIHERFSATSYGQTLAKNIRWRFFKPPEVTHAEWERLLGPDLNYRHLTVADSYRASFACPASSLPWCWMYF